MAGPVKIYRFFITPQTWVRTTQRDRWLFRIEDAELKEKYPDQHVRKLRIERYQQYKRDLRAEAERIGFDMPTDGAWIKFFLPMPRRWSKKKKARMEMEPHQSRPDASNLHKAFEDGLKKEDMMIWDYHVSKFWYSGINGFIQVEIPDANVDMKAISSMQISTRTISDILH